MYIALMFVACSLVLQGVIWLPGVWRLHKYLSVGIAVVLVIISIAVFAITHRALSLLLVYLQAISVFNLARVAKDRMQATYLRAATFRTFVVLSVLQLAVFACMYWSTAAHLTPEHWVLGLMSVIVLVQIVLSISLRRHLVQVNKTVPAKHFTDHELPTVTVAIPARNETADLDACLDSLLGSDYPKLEIIVLDDCSQLKQTPEIIKSFAHDGVRFLAGKPAPANWLAKNYAYQQLLNAASGDIVLFCGVDTRFSSSTVRDIIRQMLTRNKLMISIMPINMRPSPFQLESLLVQPLRYAWELMIPRRRFASPSVLSTTWAINKQFLITKGGFAAVKRMIIPEAYFARLSVRQADSYTFMASSAQLGLFCDKSVTAQRHTFIRTRYPQLHRRPEIVSLQALFTFSCNLLPLLITVTGLLLGWYGVVCLAVLATVLAWSNFARVVAQTYRNTFLTSYFVQPLAVLYDIGVVHYSMWRYEFNDVIWKDRNVCVSVMRVEPHLPKLP